MAQSIPGRLAGKRAIVTGAGSGIGRASALLFAAEGARVLAADKNAAAVAETVSAISEAGGTALAAGIDAGLEADVKGLVARALEAWGGLDVFYANAGITGGRVPLFEQPVELWQEVLRVNLIGPFLAIKHAGPVMVRQGSGLDRLHGLGRGPARQRRRAAVCGEQGRRHQPGADGGQRPLRHGRAGQRHLPRPDRDGHDQADVRQGARPRHRGQDRPAQPAAPVRRAARDRGRGAVPRQRRRLLRQRPGLCRSTGA